MNDLTPINQTETRQPAPFWLKWTPATLKEGTDHLLACLMLVAPTGMSAEERAGWVAVARQTLSGIPADLLKRGCDKARLTCRFASEIVPCIHNEIGKEWDRRKKRAAEDRVAFDNRHASRLEQQEAELADPEAIRELIKSLNVGATA